VRSLKTIQIAQMCHFVNLPVGSDRPSAGGLLLWRLQIEPSVIANLEVHCEVYRFQADDLSRWQHGRGRSPNGQFNPGLSLPRRLDAAPRNATQAAAICRTELIFDSILGEGLTKI